MFYQEISILHVDDEEDFLDVSKAFLEQINDKMTVDAVTSPKEALRILESKIYDVIVSDQCMPGMTGLELREELQKRGNNTPFIILSGTNKEETGSKIETLGIKSYLKKDDNPETLFKHLYSMISKIKKSKEKKMTSGVPESPQLI